MNNREYVRKGNDVVINVLGSEYTIIRRMFGDENMDGYCDYTSRTIHLRSDNYNGLEDFEWLMRKQLRHEIIHAFLAESGLLENWEHKCECGHDETFIDWFAIQFDKIHEAIKSAVRGEEVGNGKD